MNIPFLDLKSPHDELRAELREIFERIFDSGWYILGPYKEGEYVRGYQEFLRLKGK